MYRNLCETLAMAADVKDLTTKELIDLYMSIGNETSLELKEAQERAHRAADQFEAALREYREYIKPRNRP